MSASSRPTPSVEEGHRDVPISLGLLTPPEMTLDKECTPSEVVEGDTITFTVHYTNDGMADAYCVEMWDVLDGPGRSSEGTFLYWDSEYPTPTPISGPVLDSTGFSWYIGYVPGAYVYR